MIFSFSVSHPLLPLRCIYIPFHISVIHTIRRLSFYISFYISGADTSLHVLLGSQDPSADIPDVTDHLFLHTDDQHFVDTHFEQLQPPLDDTTDYIFSLEQEEGIADLFDIGDIDL